MLHEQEAWLAESAGEIGRKISEGFAAAKRGELMDAEEVRAAMEQKKGAWFSGSEWGKRKGMG